jgi:hypothetical protein
VGRGAEQRQEVDQGQHGPILLAHALAVTLGRLRHLLARAQQAGAVRADVDYADVKALKAGCLAREGGNTDRTALDRIIAVVCEGLRSRPAEQADGAGHNA